MRGLTVVFTLLASTGLVSSAALSLRGPPECRLFECIRCWEDSELCPEVLDKKCKSNADCAKDEECCYQCVCSGNICTKVSRFVANHEKRGETGRGGLLMLSAIFVENGHRRYGGLEYVSHLSNGERYELGLDRNVSEKGDDNLCAHLTLHRGWRHVE
jgi:hypothetical protein